MAFILITPLSDTSNHMDWGIVILEVPAPIGIEIFHHRIKMISDNNFVPTCGNPSIAVDKRSLIMPAITLSSTKVTFLILPSCRHLLTYSFADCHLYVVAV